jgi:hypothetical protein
MSYITLKGHWCDIIVLNVVVVVVVVAAATTTTTTTNTFFLQGLGQQPVPVQNFNF